MKEFNSMNEISVPMPFEERFIDELVSINNQIEKSKITNVYFALPLKARLSKLV